MLNNELAKSLERSCSAVSITSELRPFETPWPAVDRVELEAIAYIKQFRYPPK
jgi:hypothetical protein